MLAALFSDIGSLQTILVIAVFICFFAAIGLSISAIAHWRMVPVWRAWALRGGALVVILATVLGIRWLTSPALMNATVPDVGGKIILSPRGAGMATCVLCQLFTSTLGGRQRVDQRQLIGCCHRHALSF